MAHRVELFVVDRSGVVLGQVDTHIGGSFTLRYSDTSSWQLSLPRGHQAELFTAGSSLVVEVDGMAWASGPLYDGLNNGTTVDVQGPGDDVALARMLALPAAPSMDYGAADRDVRTGKADDLAVAYVTDNAGPGAAAGRRVLAVQPSQGRGGTVTAAARFDPLYGLLRRLLVPDGLGYQVLRGRGEPVPTFSVLYGEDRTRHVEFSESRETLGSGSQRRLLAPAATFAIAGGSGEGTARLFADATDEAAEAAWQRTEVFVEAGKEDSSLARTAAGALSGPRTSVTVEPTGSPNARWPLWRLGDLVNAQVWDSPLQPMYVVEATVDFVTGELRPGLAETATVLGQRSQLIAERLAALETRT